MEMKWAIFYLCIAIMAVEVHGKPIEEESAAKIIEMVCKNQSDIIEAKGKLRGGSPSEVDGRIKQWPSALVPYVISKDFDVKEREVIKESIEILEERTCVRFQEHADLGDAPTNHVHIIHGQGCSSYVGMIGGSQVLTLQKNDANGVGCVHKSVVQHEFLHALGFYHEHQRTDRDQYVTISSANIIKGLEGNFARIESTDVIGSDYDPKSIMHYSRNAFAIDPQLDTITWKADPGLELGGSDLTSTDIAQINSYYDCAPPTASMLSTKAAGVSPTAKPTTKSVKATIKAVKATTKSVKATTKSVRATTKSVKQTTKPVEPTIATRNPTRPGKRDTKFFRRLIRKLRRWLGRKRRWLRWKFG